MTKIKIRHTRVTKKKVIHSNSTEGYKIKTKNFSLLYYMHLKEHFLYFMQHVEVVCGRRIFGLSRLPHQKGKCPFTIFSALTAMFIIPFPPLWAPILKPISNGQGTFVAW